MTRRDRLLQIGCLGLLSLHAVAFLVWPGKLWGMSHLAVWGHWIGVAATTAAFVCVLTASGNTRRGRAVSFPGPRASAGLALLAGLVFWIGRERTHFFGDGYLLIRDRGLSETVTRAPVLVRSIGLVVRGAGDRLGIPPETAFAGLGVLAGILAVFVLLRLAALLTPDRGGRWLAALLLGTAGGMQLFFGHVEYYAWVAVAVLAYLWVACRLLQDERPLWPAALLYGGLVPLHLSTLGLAPAQAYLAWRGWRRGERRSTLLVLPAAAGLAWTLATLAGEPARSLAETTVAGGWRYIEPYLDRASPRHAFGFLGAGHLLALLDDFLLVAPLAAAALPAVLAGRGAAGDPLRRFLLWGTLGSLGLDILFNRELGPYRDWDILAAYGFVYLAWVAAASIRPHPGSLRPAHRLVLVVGLYHLVPWLALNASPRAAFAHLQLVLREPSQWSPFARGYMQEEIGIHQRERGDLDAALGAYEEAVRANPSDARYHVGLGNLCYKRGDLQRAATEFETALRHRPDYAPAHNNLAFILARQGRDLEAALQHAAAALRLAPSDPEYLTTLGEVQLRRGDLPAAERALAEALARRPRSAEATRLLEEVRRRRATPPGDSSHASP